MEGLSAMKGVVSSTALYACDPKAQLSLVLPPILESLIDTKDGLQVPLEEGKETVSASPRPSSSIQGTLHPEIEVTDEDVTAEALKCLNALFKTPNGSNVKLVLRPTFEYLDEHSIWWPASFGVGIIKAILNAILAQFRYMVVNEILSLKESVDETTSDWTLRLQKKATLVSTLEAVLVSPLKLIGMPVLEVLNSLLTGLVKSLSRSANLSKEGETSQQLVLETLIQDGLVRSVGMLPCHMLYKYIKHVEVILPADNLSYPPSFEYLLRWPGNPHILRQPGASYYFAHRRQTVVQDWRHPPTRNNRRCPHSRVPQGPVEVLDRSD